MRQIIEHKRQRRIALAALSYPEKVRIVERMREAIISIKAKGAVQMPDSVNHGLNRLAGGDQPHDGGDIHSSSREARFAEPNVRIRS